MVDRIATFAQSGSLLKELMRMQSEFATLTMQESSGLKSDTYEGIGSDTQRLLNLESEYSEISSQSENAQMALNRVNVMYSNTGSMLDLITTALTDITAALGGTKVDGSYLTAELDQGYKELGSLLNVELDDVYLFAGGGGVPPVNVNDAGYALAIDAVTPDAEYYQGSDYLAQVQAASGLTIEYGVTADSSGFEKGLRAYNLALSDPENAVVLKEAYELLREAFEEINTTQTILSSQATTMDKQIDGNTDQLNLLDSLISNIKEADLAEITVKIAELETQLEASYAVATKLLSLNLYDYIK